jgi:hypothetical protein
VLAVANVTGSLLRQHFWAAPPTADATDDRLTTVAAFELLVTNSVCELLREYGPSAISSPHGSTCAQTLHPNPSVAAGRLRATLHLVTHVAYTAACIRYVATVAHPPLDDADAALYR